MSRPPLEVRYNGTVIGAVHDHGMNVVSFTYEGALLDDGRSLALSVRLPPREAPYTQADRLNTFLDGLLPEDWVRQQLADLARLSAADTFGLLAAYGNDCAGALAFVEPTRAVESDGVRWLHGSELDSVVTKLRVAPLGASIGAGVRVSLGGVQEKFVAVVEGDRIGLPLGNTPSTHILKPTPLAPDGSERYPGIVAVEHYCMTLARELAQRAGDPRQGVSFSVPRTTVRTIADRQVLCVERFDRTGDPVQRVHQEDGCQALGLPPDSKYQKLTSGQPSLQALAGVLRRNSRDPITELRALLQQVVFTTCVGNADMHAKNISFLHVDGVRLSPMYDIVSTAAYVGVNQELGLRIGGEYHLEDVDRAALIAEAGSWGVGRRAAERAIDGVCSPLIELAAEGVADAVSSGGAAEQVEGVAARARQVAERLSTSTPA